VRTQVDYAFAWMTVSDLAMSPWALRAVAFAWGVIWGSFINVVIYRVPRELSVVRPGSHCPACGKPIAAWDNVPIVSWLVLRGRARCCGAQFSPRYAMVELLSGLIGVAVLEVTFASLPADASVLRLATGFLASFGLAMGLVAAAFIDLDHMYLPDSITIGGTLVGLATPGLRGLGWMDAIVGAAVGFAGVWLPFVVGYKAIRGRAGMGLGDAKLTMLAGAWFGWPGAAFAVFAGALQATVAALVVVGVKGKIEEPEAVVRDRQELREAAEAGDAEAQQLMKDDPLATEPAEGLLAARMPFGPFLCLAILEWMLAGTWMAERWVPTFAP
jgi:leader peptidase (prepilin peptidase) / N-methyltransferase